MLDSRQVLVLYLFYLWACSVTELCLTLCDPTDCSLPGSSVHGIFSGKNTGVGCHFLLQGIFLTQGLNPCLLCLLNCRQILSLLNHHGSTHSSLLPCSYLLIFFLNFCWHIVALQCCVSSAVQLCRGYVLDFLFFLFNQSKFMIFIRRECYP